MPAARLELKPPSVTDRPRPKAVPPKVRVDCVAVLPKPRARLLLPPPLVSTRPRPECRAADRGGVLAGKAERAGGEVAVVAAVGDGHAMTASDTAEGCGGLIGLAERALRDVQVAAAVGDRDPTGRLGAGGGDGRCGNRGEGDEAGEKHGTHVMSS